jgi:hypothetical protein
MPSINGLFRRLSVRAAKLRKDTKAEVVKICSRKSSTSTSPHGELLPQKAPSSSSLCPPQSSEPILPEQAFFRCVDFIEDPFALCQLRSLNASTKNYVEARLAEIVEMDVRKVKFDNISTVSVASDSSNISTSVQFHFENKLWYVHPLGYKVMMRFASHSRVEILVDDSWTSKDVMVLHGAMNTFRRTLRRISMDAPIVELVIASLSLMDLDRWYAFQCFMKAVDDHQMHLAITQLPQHNATNPAELYWPLAESLTIRTTEKDSAHLAR